MVLGNIPGTQIYRNIKRYQNAARVPSFLILAIESPIYFANSTYLQERFNVYMFFYEFCMSLVHDLLKLRISCLLHLTGLLFLSAGY